MGATYHNYVVVEFADGSTSVHESRDFLEKCVPAPKRYDVVQDIIWEEIQSYYSGDKTADEVAVLIDDRCSCIWTNCNKGERVKFCTCGNRL